MSPAFTRTVLLIIATTLLGCAGTGTSKENEQKAPPRAASPAMALLLDRCPLTPTGRRESLLLTLAGAAIQAFAPAIVGGIYDVAVKALEERADALTASSTATAQGTLYRPSEGQKPAAGDVPIFEASYSCLVFIRGGLADTKDKPPAGSGWSNDIAEKVSDGIKKANPQLHLKSAPELYVEFLIEYESKEAPKQPVLDDDGKPIKGDDGKAVELDRPLKTPVSVALRPTRVYYLKSGAKRNPESTKQLILQAEIKARVIKEGKWEDVTLVEGTFDLGQVPIGKEVGADLLLTKTAVKGVLVAPTVYPATVLVRTKSALQTGHVKAIDLVDIVARVTTTETEEGGDIERALAKAAKEKRDSFVKPIVDALDGWLKKQGGGDSAAKK